ncbi:MULTISPECIES: NAD(P)/FAD-dependent oxidoreductase [Staphylococcus]|uniref:NAD(P)/FAD-dependent oxidoreductase n=1 Tax=Staphylococcus pasteuri TaxID=45972 RepID=UPI000E087DD0|nr:nitrite reductase [Staphylococcus warneri]
MMGNRTVIVGGSIAGVFTAKELRKNEYQGEILIIESENRLPYDKPPLTKEWMQDLNNTTLPLLEKENFYDDNNIEIALNTKVVSIDSYNKQINTESKETIDYNNLVLATGTKVRTLENTKNVSGVNYLSNYLDAVNIKRNVQSISKNIVILGGGFIGLELAASLIRLNQNVTLISRSKYPLGKVIGQQASSYIKQLHERKGVNVIAGDTIKSIEGKNNIEQIVTNNGLKIDCDLLIIGIGTNFEAIKNVGNKKIEYNNQGYIVDKYGQTSVKDVYAVGDCAVWPYNNDLINVKHWENAYNQGKNVAKNIIEGSSSMFNVIPYFWSDQYDDGFEYLGYIKDWSRTEVEGNIDEGKFSITYLDNSNKPCAVFFANGYKDKAEVQKYLSDNQ